MIGKIIKGDDFTHDDVKFAFAFSCIQRGLSVKFEVLTNGCRADVTIYDADGRFAFVEVKRSKRDSPQKWLSTRQAGKYSKFNIPTIFLDGIGSVELAVAKLLDISRNKINGGLFLRINGEYKLFNN